MRKQGFCMCENKDADQLRGNREADQRLCFRYINSTFPLLSESEISSLKPYSVIAQPGLCQILSETPKNVWEWKITSTYFNISIVFEISKFEIA